MPLRLLGGVTLPVLRGVVDTAKLVMHRAQGCFDVLRHTVEEAWDCIKKPWAAPGFWNKAKNLAVSPFRLLASLGLNAGKLVNEGILKTAVGAGAIVGQGVANLGRGVINTLPFGIKIKGKQITGNPIANMDFFSLKDTWRPSRAPKKVFDDSTWRWGVPTSSTPASPTPKEEKKEEKQPEKKDGNKEEGKTPEKKDEKKDAGKDEPQTPEKKEDNKNSVTEEHTDAMRKKLKENPKKLFFLQENKLTDFMPNFLPSLVDFKDPVQDDSVKYKEKGKIEEEQKKKAGEIKKQVAERKDKMLKEAKDQKKKLIIPLNKEGKILFCTAPEDETVSSLYYGILQEIQKDITDFATKNPEYITCIMVPLQDKEEKNDDEKSEKEKKDIEKETTFPDAKTLEYTREARLPLHKLLEEVNKKTKLTISYTDDTDGASYDIADKKATISIGTNLVSSSSPYKIIGDTGTREYQVAHKIAHEVCHVFAYNHISAGVANEYKEVYHKILEKRSSSAVGLTYLGSTNFYAHKGTKVQAFEDLAELSALFIMQPDAFFAHMAVLTRGEDPKLFHVDTESAQKIGEKIIRTFAPILQVSEETHIRKLKESLGQGKEGQDAEEDAAVLEARTQEELLSHIATENQKHSQWETKVTDWYAEKVAKEKQRDPAISDEEAKKRASAQIKKVFQRLYKDTIFAHGTKVKGTYDLTKTDLDARSSKFLIQSYIFAGDTQTKNKTHDEVYAALTSPSFPKDHGLYVDVGDTAGLSIKTKEEDSLRNSIIALDHHPTGQASATYMVMRALQITGLLPSKDDQVVKKFTDVLNIQDSYLNCSGVVAYDSYAASLVGISHQLEPASLFALCSHIDAATGPLDKIPKDMYATTVQLVTGEKKTVGAIIAEKNTEIDKADVLLDKKIEESSSIVIAGKKFIVLDARESLTDTMKIAAAHAGYGIWKSFDGGGFFCVHHQGIPPALKNTGANVVRNVVCMLDPDDTRIDVPHVRGNVLAIIEEMQTPGAKKVVSSLQLTPMKKMQGGKKKSFHKKHYKQAS